MITAVGFIPRGYAREVPKHYELSVEERRVIEEGSKWKSNEDEVEEEFKRSEQDVIDNEGDNDASLNAKKEDEDEDEDEDEMDVDENLDINEEDNAESEFLANYTLSDGLGKILEDGIDEDDEDLGSDKEDFVIKDTDHIILAASTDDDNSCLEMHVYDEAEGSLFVHHDIALPSFPLCFSWMGTQIGYGEYSGQDDQGRNFVAVGTFHPQIEVWNLDVLDALEPTMTLGGPTNDASMNSTFVTQSELKPESHSDAVMCLSWNANHPTLLLSGSADKSMKLWDLEHASCVHTFAEIHRNRISAVDWNPAEGTVALSGSFDKRVGVFDARNPAAVAYYQAPADVECAKWNPMNPATFAVSTENGEVAVYDVRNGPSHDPLYLFKAHKKSTTSLSFSPLVDGLFATASEDRKVKLWDLNDTRLQTSARKPGLVASKDMGLGKLFDVSLSQSSPFLLCAGGSKGLIAVWESNENEVVERVFSGRVSSQHSLKHEAIDTQEPLSSQSNTSASQIPNNPNSVLAESVSSSSSLPTSATNVSTASEKLDKRKRNKKKKNKKKSPSSSKDQVMDPEQ